MTLIFQKQNKASSIPYYNTLQQTACIKLREEIKRQQWLDCIVNLIAYLIV
jgi:hypothetical protein